MSPDDVQAHATAVVNVLAAELRSSGWDFVAITLSRCVRLPNGDVSLPGASTFEADPVALPGLPSLADSLRALARELDAVHTASGSRTAAESYTHVIDSSAVRRAARGDGGPT